jgi:Cu+-exporting ATPase
MRGDDMKVTKEFKIDGMTCAACSRAAERAINKLDGIEEATVNLSTEKAQVIYNDDKINSQDIIGAIDKAGYKGSVVEALNEIVIPIEGMT